MKRKILLIIIGASLTIIIVLYMLLLTLNNDKKPKSILDEFDKVDKDLQKSNDSLKEKIDSIYVTPQKIKN